MSPDSLQLDSTLVSTLASDPRFNYDRELTGGGKNVLEWLSELIGEWLRKNLGVALDSDVTYYILLVVGALLVGLLGYLVWRRRRSLFVGNEQSTPLDYEVGEDTIYGVDFEADIAEMVLQANWRQAVRLVYLYTLKQLSDAARIDWQPSKTPTQYVAEVGDTAFAAMSRHFIQVRYGNFDADEPLFNEMKTLQEQVVKGGTCIQ